MSNVSAKHVKKAAHWREKFGGPSRKPRPSNPEVAAFLHDCWPTEVFLREDATTTDIVLRFPLSSKQLSEEIQKKYFRREMSLSKAFDEIVWAAPEKGKHSCWARFAKAGYDAYWAAWMQFFDVAYREHLFPEGNKQTDIWIDELRSSRRTRSSSGRRSVLDSERRSYERRFDELLQWCTDLQDFVKRCNEEGLSKDVIGHRVFQKISGQRHDHNILSGKAFDWAVNRNEPVLHDWHTWTPKRLAISLLALERGCKPDWITRKIQTGRL